MVATWRSSVKLTFKVDQRRYLGRPRRIQRFDLQVTPGQGTCPAFRSNTGFDLQVLLLGNVGCDLQVPQRLLPRPARPAPLVRCMLSMLREEARHSRSEGAIRRSIALREHERGANPSRCRRPESRRAPRNHGAKHLRGRGLVSPHKKNAPTLRGRTSAVVVPAAAVKCLGPAVSSVLWCDRCTVTESNLWPEGLATPRECQRY